MYKPVAGVQTYVEPPVAVNVVALPVHIVAELAAIVGRGFGVAVTLEVVEQEFNVEVNVEVAV